MPSDRTVSCTEQSSHCRATLFFSNVIRNIYRLATLFTVCQFAALLFIVVNNHITRSRFFFFLGRDC